MDQRTPKVGPFGQAVAAAIRSAAAERRITQKEVAAKTGIPERSLVRYWNAQSRIDIESLVEIASAIGVQAEDIVEAARVISNRAENNAGR